MILFSLLITLAHARYDFFETECERHLIAADVSFEDLTDHDLEQFRLNTAARIHLFGHPLDTVYLRLVEHEIETRRFL